MVADLPLVSVWADAGSQWNKVGEIAAYESLEWEPRFLDPGTWSMTLPYDAVALSLTTARLVTVDWRNTTSTWVVESFVPSSDDQTGAPMLTVGGVGALSLLGRELAWPRPLNTLANQTDYDASTSYATGFTETVVLKMITENYVTRRGSTLTIPASLGRGLTNAKLRPKFDNLLELAVRKMRRGGLGLNVNLVRSSALRANLTVVVNVPTDKTLRVRLSQKVGTLRSWSQTNTAPTVTEALVGGAGTGSTRVWRAVSTSDSTTAATAWGGKRVAFVDAADSFDNTDLDQAGQEALDQGAATTSLALEAAEATGLLAFRDYNVGDKATAELETGLTLADTISAIKAQVTDTGVEVTPTFGDPDELDPQLTMAQMVKAQRRRIRALEQRR